MRKELYRLWLWLSKNFTTSQVFKFLRITDTTQTEYSAVVEHPDRFELNSATAMVEHPGMRTKSWTGKVKNGKKIYGRRKRKGNQTI